MQHHDCNVDFASFILTILLLAHRHTNFACLHSAPQQVILHGLNGSSDDAYVRYLAAIARSSPQASSSSSQSSSPQESSPYQRPPFRVAAFLMRGCGDMPLTTRRGYSAADSNDFADAMDQVEQASFNVLLSRSFSGNTPLGIHVSLLQFLIFCSSSSS